MNLRPINIGRDYGSTLEMLGGVSVSDAMVINPPDSLEERPAGEPRGDKRSRSADRITGIAGNRNLAVRRKRRRSAAKPSGEKGERALKRA